MRRDVEDAADKPGADSKSTLDDIAECQGPCDFLHVDHCDHAPHAEKAADDRKGMATGRSQEAPSRVGQPHRRTTLGGGGGNWPVCGARKPCPACKLTLFFPETRNGSRTGSSANDQSLPLAAEQASRRPPKLTLSRRSSCNSAILPQTPVMCDLSRPPPVLNLVHLALRP